MMADHPGLEALFKNNGFTDFRWLDPKEIVVAQWVRMKCMFGCDEYGRTATCPPDVPSLAECERFFREYSQAVVFHCSTRVEKPGDRHAWTRGLNIKLLKLERDVFCAGNQKAFMIVLDSCTLCADCSAQRTTCKEPLLARPTPEALGVDVFATVRKVGYPIDVLSSYDQEMNRYAFLMID
jgi:predicted metal-binding protein